MVHTCCQCKKNPRDGELMVCRECRIKVRTNPKVFVKNQPNIPTPDIRGGDRDGAVAEIGVGVSIPITARSAG